MSLIQTPWTSQPQQAVGIDLSHPVFANGNTPVFAWQAGAGLIDVDGRALSPVGSVSKVINQAGANAYATGTGNRLEFGKNVSPPTRICTLIVGFRAVSLSSTARLFSSHSSSNTSGIYLAANSSGTLELGSGDGAGVNSTNRRSLSSSAGAIVAGNYYSFVGGFSSDTTGQIILNGNEITPTASGTGSTYVTGSGSGMACSYFNGGSYFYGNQEISHIVVLPKYISTALAKSISQNPWQIFKPIPRRIFVPVSAGGGTTAVTSDHNASYTITGSVAADASAAYAIRAAVTSDATASYALRAAVAADSAASYALRAAAQADQSAAYAIRAAVAADSAASYALRAAAQADQSAAYAIRAAAASDLAGSYAIQAAGTVTTGLDAAYAVRGSVAGDISVGYQIAAAVQAEVAAAYAVRAAVQKDLAAGYSVPDSVTNVASDIVCTYAINGVSPSYPSAESIATAILAAAQITPIHADTRKVIGQGIVGAGTEANPWGPA